MVTIECTKGDWIEVATGVTSFVFNLKNSYPDALQKCGYKITYNATGTGTPEVDTEDCVYYELDTNGKVYAFPIEFNNSTPQDIYVMSMFDDGSITY